jgi:secreted trypsin-like serine protease
MNAMLAHAGDWYDSRLAGRGAEGEMRYKVAALAAAVVVASTLVATGVAGAIVHGSAVPDHGDAWVVSIHKGATPTTKNLVCGGTHIAPQFVLTAKQCLDTDLDGTIEAGEHQPTALWFSFDRTKISETGRGEVIRGASVAFNADNDLAIVKLARPATRRQSDWRRPRQRSERS